MLFWFGSNIPSFTLPNWRPHRDDIRLTWHAIQRDETLTKPGYVEEVIKLCSQTNKITHFQQSSVKLRLFLETPDQRWPTYSVNLESEDHHGTPSETATS